MIVISAKLILPGSREPLEGESSAFRMGFSASAGTALKKGKRGGSPHLSIFRVCLLPEHPSLMGHYSAILLETVPARLLGWGEAGPRSPGATDAGGEAKGYCCGYCCGVPLLHLPSYAVLMAAPVRSSREAASLARWSQLTSGPACSFRGREGSFVGHGLSPRAFQDAIPFRLAPLTAPSPSPAPRPQHVTS